MITISARYTSEKWPWNILVVELAGKVAEGCVGD